MSQFHKDNTREIWGYMVSLEDPKIDIKRYQKLMREQRKRNKRIG